MNANKLMTFLATTITTIDETGGEIKEGILYAGLMQHDCAHDEFRTLVFAMVEGGLVERVSGWGLRITQKGKELAARLHQAVAKVKAGV